MQIFFNGETCISQEGCVVEEYKMKYGMRCFEGYLDSSSQYRDYVTTLDIFDAKIFPNMDKALDAVSVRKHFYPYDDLKHKIIRVNMTFEKVWEN